VSNFADADDQLGGGEEALVFAGFGPSGEVAAGIDEGGREECGNGGEVRGGAEGRGEGAVGFQGVFEEDGGGEGDLDGGAVELGDRALGVVAGDDDDEVAWTAAVTEAKWYVTTFSIRSTSGSASIFLYNSSASMVVAHGTLTVGEDWQPSAASVRLGLRVQML
jgi:hypothetical protein